MYSGLAFASSGKYVVNAKDPFFEEYRTYRDLKFGKETQTGLPYSIILWQTFHGNAGALEKALQAIWAIFISTHFRIMLWCDVWVSVLLDVVVVIFVRDI